MERNQGYRYGMNQRSCITRQNFPVQEPRCGCEQKKPMPEAIRYPIAMAYVPWQTFATTYPLCEGFSIGTIFPELNLPFERERCKCK